MLKFNTFATIGNNERSPDLRRWDTGTCFDNVLISTRDRPGQHINQDIVSEPGAFARFRPTTPPDPKNFMRKGTGWGGQRTLTPLDKKRLELLQDHRTVLKGPPPAMAYHRRCNPPNTDFRRYYDRGDLPVKVLHGTFRKVCWLRKIDDIDYYHILPLFFDGLREEEEPYQFLAFQGSLELLVHQPSQEHYSPGKTQSSQDRVLPVIPQLIIPLKNALNTRDHYIMVKALKTLKYLALCGPAVGEALVPYYRQLLPVINIFKHCDRNLGDMIDYHQQCEDNLGVIIQETLNVLEMNGGPDAFINIKYMVPTYESCMLE